MFHHLLLRTAARSACSKSLLLLLAFSCCIGHAYAQKNAARSNEFYGPAAEKIIPGASFVREGDHSPFPAFVRFSDPKKIAFSNFFSWLQKTIPSNPGIGFKQLKSETDKLGMTHYRYVQTFQDVVIDKTTYIVHVKDGFVTSFNGEAVNPAANGKANPSLTEPQALQMALRFVGAKKYKWEDDRWQNDLKQRSKNPNATYFPKGELTWVADNNNQKMDLAWKFDINSADPDKVQRIFVHAGNGSIINKVPLESNCEPPAAFNSIFNGSQTVQTEKYLTSPDHFRLKDNCTSAIVYVRDWGGVDLTNNMTEIENTTNTWTTTNERFGATVQWLTRTAYNYWQSEHSRNSYDNSGGDVNAFINAMFDCSPPAGCVTPNNASMSFSGGTMKVGFGTSLANSFAAMDIIGHEYTHAVTGSSAALVYQKESGALNESFSDIFGEATENFAFGSHDWLMGAERASGAIRNMSNPNARSDPDTYLGTFWVSTTTATDVGGDNWGVHTNSGVQNFWFYLLTVGGSGTNDNGDAYSVTGIGLEAASAIAYRSLTQYLSSGSGYFAARDGAISAASDLYGACSNEVKQVINAWHAVGVGAVAFDAVASVTSSYNGRDVSCHNACDGSATVNVVSTFFPTYDWSNGAHTQSVSGLCPGTYSVTVTDFFGLGCSVTKFVTIQNTPLLVASPVVTSNYNGYGVACNGDNNGTATANPSGGTPPYTYSWSNGQTTANATGLSAGPYSVTVTDANGCTAIGNIFVTQPPPLLNSAAATSNYNGYNVRCHGGSDGVAEAFPSGGVAPYSYLWSDGQTTKVASGLSATTYTCTVTDANGCSKTSAPITLTEPPQLTINAGPNKIVYLGYPDSACTNLTYSGAGGGVPPYTITWSTGSMATTINVCPTVSTWYYVTILDANGCSFRDSARVCVIDVRCGNNLDKVVICHRTNSKTNPNETLCIALSAAKNHFQTHPEDQLAACGTVKVCNDIDPVVKSGIKVPVEASLEGNLEVYPNPFVSRATVRFKIDKTDRVELRIYDVSGKSIGILYKGLAEANKVYTVNYNSGLLTSGVYLLRLTTQRGKSYTSKITRAE